MTSIEWLLSKISSKIDDEYWSNQQNITEYVEIAKEMHKQEIMDAAERWKGTDFAERYYQETFASKGSDDTVKSETKFLGFEFTLKDGSKQYVPCPTETTSDEVELPKQDVDKLGNEDVPKLGYEVEKLADEQYKNENIFSELKGLLVSAKKFGFIDGYNKAKETLYTKEQLPQQEISDEEIEKAAPTGNLTTEMGFIQGAKWYREQLKSK